MGLALLVASADRPPASFKATCSTGCAATTNRTRP